MSLPFFAFFLADGTEAVTAAVAMPTLAVEREEGVEVEVGTMTAEDFSEFNGIPGCERHNQSTNRTEAENSPSMVSTSLCLVANIHDSPWS